MEGFKKVIDRIIEMFCITIMVAMTVLVSWQVFTRYVLNKPSAVTEQLAQYLFVWLVLYGAAYVFGKRDHMAILFFREKQKPKVQLSMNVLQEIVTMLFAVGVMVVGGFISSKTQMVQLDAALQIPIGVVYSALPISGGMIVFYCINNIKTLYTASKI